MTVPVYTSNTGGTVAECYDSPTSTYGESATSKTHLRAVGFDSEYNAYLAAVQWVSTNRPTYNGLTVDEIDCQPIPGTNAYDIHVNYKVYQFKEELVLDHQFSTTGGTEHIYASMQTLVNQSCITGEPSIDFGGAINFKDGTVEGLDVKWPAFQWKQTQAFSLARVNRSFIRMMRDYTNSVNSVPYRGFDVGEVMFDGVQGGLQTKYSKVDNKPFQYYKLQFSFSVRPGRTESFGDSMYYKRGWDYSWLTWQKLTDESGNVVTVPRNVCVEKVYPYVDLHNLGLVEIS